MTGQQAPGSLPATPADAGASAAAAASAAPDTPALATPAPEIGRPVPKPLPARLWAALRSRWARQFGIVAVVFGTVAAVGHFVGGMIGWWHAYEITFGTPHHNASTTAKQAATPGKAPSVSLVVLPLTNESGSNADEWFSDGLTADLTTELGRITGSLVIARDTAFTYKGKVVDPREVARELGVRYVVSGAARRVDERVRLNLSIVDGETGTQRWAQNFDVYRAELSRSFDDITQQIARALWMEIYRSAGDRASKLKPHEVVADDLAMQGWGYWFRGISKENVASALVLCEEAVAKDPRSIRGWGGVSVMNFVGIATGFAPDKEAARQRLLIASERLQQLDPNDFFAIQSRVSVANVAGDWPTMLLVADSLAERYPSEPSGHQNRASALLNMGQFEQSIAAAERALRISKLDPRAGVWYFQIATSQFMLERYAEAVENARRATVASPMLPFAGLLAPALVRDGRKAEGEQVLREHLSRFPGHGEETIRSMMRSAEPRYAAGRERMIASLREIGLR